MLSKTAITKMQAAIVVVIMIIAVAAGYYYTTMTAAPQTIKIGCISARPCSHTTPCGRVPSGMEMKRDPERCPASVTRAERRPADAFQT
jgi:hypothetical protein